MPIVLESVFLVLDGIEMPIADEIQVLLVFHNYIAVLDCDCGECEFNLLLPFLLIEGIICGSGVAHLALGFGEKDALL